MNKIVAILLGIFLFASVASGEKLTYDEGVLILTDANFDIALSVFGTVLIDFYAPWCQHCKNLEPEFIKAAKALQIAKKGVTFGKMDVTIETKTAERYRIGAYPTLLFIKDQRLYEYRGGHSKEALMEWVEKAMGPSYINITNNEELDVYRENSTVTAVFFGSHDAESFEQFKEASKTFITQADVEFLATDDVELAAKYNVNGKGEVIIFKKHDADEHVKNDFTAEDLKTYVETSDFPVVAKFDDRFAEKIFRNMLSAVFLLVGDTEADKQAEAELLSVKDQLRGKIRMAVSNTGEKIGKKLMDFVNAEKKDLPAIRIVGPEGTDVARYPLKGPITGENIVKFVNDYRDGRLKATYKSQEIPETNDGPIKIVVGNTYRDIVFDDTKDVLIEIYAPWCHHCKDFEPRYEQIANRLSGSANLILAKMDGTANDKPGGAVESFPTILLYKAGDKDKPEAYKGSYQIEEVIDFIKQHATTKIVDSSYTPESTQQEQPATTNQDYDYTYEDANSKETAPEQDRTLPPKREKDEL